MKRKISVVTALIVSFAMLAGCSANPKVTEPIDVSVPVEITKATKQSIEQNLIYAGQINPEQSVSVASKINGKVDKTFFEVGDRINAGDVLYTMDKKDIENQIRQLQAQLNVADKGIKSANTSLKSAKGGQFQTQVLQLEGQLETAKKQKENAEFAFSTAQTAYGSSLENYNRIKTLYDSGTVSKSEFDRAESDLEQRKNAMEQAQISIDTTSSSIKTIENNLGIVSEQISSENVERAEVGVEQAVASKGTIAAQIANAQSTIADASVKSPISGIVSAKQVKAGEMTSSAVSAYTIVSNENVIVKVKVSELIINSINVGQDVAVRVGAVNDKPITGTIKTISPAADQTSTYPVEINLVNKDLKLKPGMFAEVSFLRAKSDNAIVLPRNTVIEDIDETFVFVNENGVAKKVPVETGIDNGQQIEILKGLSENQEIISKGQTFVRENDKLKIVSNDENKGA